MSITAIVTFVLVPAIGLVLISMIVEALRPTVSIPARLAWSADIGIQ